MGHDEICGDGPFITVGGGKGPKMIGIVGVQPESDEPVEFGMAEGLLSGCAGLLVILLWMVIGLRRRLARIEKSLGSRASVPLTVAEHAPPVAETSPGGAFEAFLMEDPARLKLPKREQFKAYRKWRQEHRMNWSTGPSPEES